LRLNLSRVQEITAAAKLLEPLCQQGDISNPALRSAVGRIYLQGGNIQMAAKHFALVEDDPSADDTLKTMNAALLASSEGDWIEASEKLREILEKDAEDYVVRNCFCEVVVGIL
jgi:predicted Zn-dependent protease